MSCSRLATRDLRRLRTRPPYRWKPRYSRTLPRNFAIQTRRLRLSTHNTVMLAPRPPSVYVTANTFAIRTARSLDSSLDKTVTIQVFTEA